MKWCERGESNPHGCPLDPKSSASANSATLANLEASTPIVLAIGMRFNMSIRFTKNNLGLPSFNLQTLKQKARRSSTGPTT